MSRPDRLTKIMQTLQDGRLHTAQELADAFAVSPRTIYRDMDDLMASGLPVKGARGIGYQAQPVTTLPSLHLTDEEIEVLNLGLAIVSEAADPDLRRAATSLGAKLETALPQHATPDAQTWAYAASSFGDSARGLSQMPTLRAAIRAKQKLRITYHSKGDRITSRIIRPLKLEHWARVWILTAWCETRNDFREFRVDLIQSAQAQPQMFVDEVGKTLDDMPSPQA
ncbi:WYL domain-containing protein [Pseudosulfitobacter sp. SM2401]|uniref:helix-turn-helix transcriptional regulator n=1 Tax=Pseudosulfitobacter sp. SM2401 TaxID=3350098 RepID=UPI0036F1DE74